MRISRSSRTLMMASCTHLTKCQEFFVGYGTQRQLLAIGRPLKRQRTFKRDCLGGNGTKWHLSVFHPPLTLTFAEVASHNHFVLDRGGKVCNRTAPIIKMPSDATEADHFALLGLLNSSTACFYLKQVSHQKQMMGGDGVVYSPEQRCPINSPELGFRSFPSPSLLRKGHSGIE